MTFVRLLTGLVLLMACAVIADPVIAADDAPPPAQDQPAGAPAAVYVRPLDEQGRAAAVVAPAPAPSGPTIDSVISVMKKLGMLSASALLMLVGSALAGVLLAGLILLIRKRRAAT